MIALIICILQNAESVPIMLKGLKSLAEVL
jgi:hypothetical protein